MNLREQDLCFIFLPRSSDHGYGPKAHFAEQTIRDAVQNGMIKYTDDNFFWSGAYDKPIIGKSQREEGRKKAEAEEPRKNEVSADHPQRVVFRSPVIWPTNTEAVR